MFIAECTAVALLGALVGTAASLLLGAACFRAYVLNPIPGAAAVAVTLLVVACVFGGRRNSQFAELLSDP